MSSEDRFTPPGKVQSGDVYEVFSSLDESVLTTSEIDEQIDWASRSTVLRKLNDMKKSGQLQSKKAGNKENAGVVWYLPEEIEDVPQPTPDLIRVIYRHPWFSMLTGGLLFAGLGFALFMPSYFGEGLYLGLFPREPLVLVSIGLYVFGILVASVGGALVIWETVVTLIQNKLD